MLRINSSASEYGSGRVLCSPKRAVARCELQIRPGSEVGGWRLVRARETGWGLSGSPFVQESREAIVSRFRPVALSE